MKLEFVLIPGCPSRSRPESSLGAVIDAAEPEPVTANHVVSEAELGAGRSFTEPRTLLAERHDPNPDGQPPTDQLPARQVPTWHAAPATAQASIDRAPGNHPPPDTGGKGDAARFSGTDRSELCCFWLEPQR